MTRASLDAVRRTITVNWPHATEQGAKNFLIQFAQTDINRISARQGPPTEVFANRPGNANLQSVTLPGPIVAIFDSRRRIALEALELLWAASPVQSGRYRNSHTILLNGKQVADLPAALIVGDVIAIVNPVPYARRIEIGKTQAGRDFVIQIPNRIYERVAKSKLMPKYRNVASITFGYIDIEGAALIKGGLGASYAVKTKAGRTVQRKRRQQVGKAVQAPAIFIRSLRSV